VHGPEACGKSGIVRAVLDAYTYSNATPTATTTTKADDVPAIKKRKRRQIEPNNDHDPAQGNSLRYSLVKVAECITTRHLLTKLVSAVLDAVRPSNSSSPAHITEEEWVEIAKGARCEHVSSLPGVLGEILCRARCEKFVLVLDGVDDLREGGQMLLAALARVGETVRSSTILGKRYCTENANIRRVFFRSVHFVWSSS
jgi:origin recognition complex subunit 5